MLPEGVEPFLAAAPLYTGVPGGVLRCRCCVGRCMHACALLQLAAACSWLACYADVPTLLEPCLV